MKKIITLIFLFISFNAFSQTNPNDKKIEFIDSKVQDGNQMQLYYYKDKLDPTVLVAFMKVKKSEYKGRGFYYCVIFDSKKEAVFPKSPFTAEYGIEEKPMLHIRSFYTYNSKNGYSVLRIYLTNMLESSPKEYQVK